MNMVQHRVEAKQFAISLLNDTCYVFMKTFFEDWFNKLLGGKKFKLSYPMAFTEQGVAMLSSVLRSKKAILFNIEIMKAFAWYRALLIEKGELHYKIDLLEEKVNKVFIHLTKRMDALHESKSKKIPLGFK